MRRPYPGELQEHPRHSDDPQQMLMAHMIWTTPPPDPNSPSWNYRDASLYYSALESVRLYGARGPPGSSSYHTHPTLVADWLESRRRAWHHPDITPYDFIERDRELIGWINRARIRNHIGTLERRWVAVGNTDVRREMADRIRALLWAPRAWEPEAMRTFCRLYSLDMHEYPWELICY